MGHINPLYSLYLVGNFDHDFLRLFPRFIQPLGKRLISAQPSDLYFILNLFEFRVAGHKLGFSDFCQSRGKTIGVQYSVNIVQKTFP